MVAHTVSAPGSDVSGSVSLSSHMLHHHQASLGSSDISDNYELSEEECHSSSVAHSVSVQRTSSEVHVAAIETRLHHSQSHELEDHAEVVMETIGQVDGVNDDSSSSDEDM